MIKEAYFYTINYPVYQEDLCMMEMKYLFGIIPSLKYFLTNKNIDPSRSPFIKDRIKILYSEDTLSDIAENIVRDNLAYDDFKITFIKLLDTDIEYKERLSLIRQIGWVIIGEAEMHNPKVHLALTKVNGKWIFGEYERNNYEWHIHDEKPFSYSNSLEIRVAKALVNIAIGEELNKELIDPCCGVGTVVIEALSMDINVCGNEIKEKIAEDARNNIEFFGYDKEIIKHGDMHEIKKHYDVAIIDLPYGLFTPVTKKEQKDIIKTARRIADQVILVTFEDMKDDIKEAGFTIIDRCFVSKGNFMRYIDICK